MSKARVRPFTGRGEWLDRPHDDSALSHEERCHRLRSFLHSDDKSLPGELIDVLAHCRTWSEIRFIYQIVTTSNWRKQSERTITNGTHNITLGASVGGHTVDFLVEDLLNSRRVAFEVRGPRSYLPGEVTRDRRRWSEIENHVDSLVHVSADQAKRAGQKQRQAICRIQLQSLQRLGIPEARPQNLRHWPGRFGYNVESLSLDERLPVMLDWLQSKNVVIPNEAIKAAVQCDHAGELLFLSQIASLPQCQWVGSSCSIGGTYLFKVRPEILTFRISFGIKPNSEHASQRKSVVIIHPAHRLRDTIAEREQDRLLLERGYTVYREAAENAKALGYQWKDRLLHDLI